MAVLVTRPSFWAKRFAVCFEFPTMQDSVGLLVHDLLSCCQASALVARGCYQLVVLCRSCTQAPLPSYNDENSRTRTATAAAAAAAAAAVPPGGSGRCCSCTPGFRPPKSFANRLACRLKKAATFCASTAMCAPSCLRRSTVSVASTEASRGLCLRGACRRPASQDTGLDASMSIPAPQAAWLLQLEAPHLSALWPAWP